MRILTYPLRYLALKDEHGTMLFVRDVVAVIIIASILSGPFLLTRANFYAEDGFLERFSSFFGVLTGFYIAALVGIASFVSTLGDLDKVIEVGRITVRDKDGEDTPLTRRQYVSAMFGYLAFISLALSVSAIFMIVIADPISSFVGNWVGVVGVILFNTVFAHMIVTTFHGLYYFIDRLYDKEPVPSPKPTQRPSKRGISA